MIWLQNQIAAEIVEIANLSQKDVKIIASVLNINAYFLEGILCESNLLNYKQLEHIVRLIAELLLLHHRLDLNKHNWDVFIFFSMKIYLSKLENKLIHNYECKRRLSIPCLFVDHGSFRGARWLTEPLNQVPSLAINTPYSR